MNNIFEYKKEIYSIALQAATIQKDAFGTIISTTKKENISNIVSEIDVECDNLIVKNLQKLYPTFNIISEESGCIMKKSDYTWVVDPLDGTSNFTAGIDWFGILIALFYKNKPIAAGALLPSNNNFYYAELNKGAYINNNKLKIEYKKLSDSLFAFSTDSTTDHSYLEFGIDIYRYLVKHCRNIRSTNSLVDMLYVAENKLGGCVNLYTKLWDIAAPYLIIKEAGGEFGDIYAKSIDFDLTDSNYTKNYGIIATVDNSMSKLILERAGLL